MTSNFICTPEYIVNGVSVNYTEYCEYQKTLKRSERYYYCQNPGCYEGFDVKVRNPRTTMFCCDECNHAYKRHIGQQSIIEYNLNPNLCEFDNKPIRCYSNNPKNLIDIKRKKFCNRSCSTKYNNQKRGEHSEKTKNKISISMKASPLRFVPVKKGSKGYIKNILNDNQIRDINGRIMYILHCNNNKCFNFFSWNTF